MKDYSGTTQTDVELIRQVQAEDEVALSQLMKRYNPDIWPMILANSRNYSDAEEILADTWISVWKNIGSLRNVSSFGAWLAKIAYNQCKRYYNTLYHAIGERPEEADVIEARLNEGAEARYRAAQRRADVREAVANLPEKVRDVTALFYFTGRRITDIAEELDIPEGSVKRKLSEARAILRETLKPE